MGKMGKNDFFAETEHKQTFIFTYILPVEMTTSLLPLSRHVVIFFHFFLQSMHEEGRERKEEERGQRDEGIGKREKQEGTVLSFLFSVRGYLGGRASIRASASVRTASQQQSDPLHDDTHALLPVVLIRNYYGWSLVFVKIQARASNRGWLRTPVQQTNRQRRNTVKVVWKERRREVKEKQTKDTLRLAPFLISPILLVIIGYNKNKPIVLQHKHDNPKVLHSTSVAMQYQTYIATIATVIQGHTIPMHSTTTRLQYNIRRGRMTYCNCLPG